MRIDQLVISILWLSCGMCIAGTAGPVAKKPAWSFGGRALYLHPSLGGNGLGYSTFSNAGVDTFGNLIETNGAPNNIANIAVTVDGLGEVELSETDVLVFAVLTNPTQ